MPPASPYVEQVTLLISRLERVSVDSIWARRSSGHRGALLHWLETYQQAGSPLEINEAEAGRLSALTAAGFRFLEFAARQRLR